MGPTPKTQTLGVLLVSALFLLVSASAATVAMPSPAPMPVNDDGSVNPCPDHSPDAWVNYCIEIEPEEVTVPWVDAHADPGLPDPNCMGTTWIEPITGVKVPVPNNLICMTPEPDVWVKPDEFTVDVLKAEADVDPNSQQILGDVCEIVTGDRDRCQRTITQALADSSANGYPDGLVFYFDGEPTFFLPLH